MIIIDKTKKRLKTKYKHEKGKIKTFYFEKYELQIKSYWLL